MKHSPARVLDIGCGEGWLGRELSQTGIDVTGIDGSSSLIEAANKLGGGRFMHLTFSDFQAVPSSAGADYDVVVFNFALLDRDIREVLSAARAAARTEGRLVLQTIHPFNDIDGAYEDGWRVEKFAAFEGEWKEMPWYFRTMSTWINEVRDAGWQISRIQEPVHPVTRAPASLIIEAIKPPA